MIMGIHSLQGWKLDAKGQVEEREKALESFDK